MVSFAMNHQSMAIGICRLRDDRGGSGFRGFGPSLSVALNFECTKPCLEVFELPHTGRYLFDEGP